MHGGFMAVVRAFHGYRPQVEKAEAVASVPYDVINSNEARAIAKDNPLSFLHVVKPEIDLPEDVDSYDDEVYAKGRENLDRLISDGVLFREKQPALYLYQQQMGAHVQTGLVGLCSIDDYANDIIKKHEHTRAAKERDRIRHVDALNANTGPVFLTYKQRADIDAVIQNILIRQKPVYDFSANDGITHRLWIISESETIITLERAFAEISHLYVADGHHRSASAAKVGEMRRAANASHKGDEAYNYFLAVLFPDQQLQILDYNRVVRDLNGLSVASFLKALANVFTVEEKDSAFSPPTRHQFGMYVAGQWYGLSTRQITWDEDDPVDRLDVSILSKLILEPTLGIGDLRLDERIDFVGGMRGMDELSRRVDSGEMAVAFSLHPTSITDLMAIADSGNVMPPKTTWFEPKLRSGLIVNRLDGYLDDIR
jgi:uncharacterized protein (DUF1015 family)